MTYQSSELSKDQSELLTNFLHTFLPVTDSKRKYTSNEIQYLGDTINLICDQYLKFKIPYIPLLNHFDNLGYTIFKKPNVINPKNGNIEAGKKTNEWTGK